MDTTALTSWAHAHSDGPVDASSNKAHSLTSKLLRFRWNDAPTVAVGSDAPGKTRINAVLDGVAWHLATAPAADTVLNLILGRPTALADGSSALVEQLGAIGTLVNSLLDGPAIEVWAIDDDADTPVPLALAPASFTSATPQRWNALLMEWAALPASGLAAQAVHVVGHPSFALYPKLSSTKGPQPWQMRLDGLDIGRIGPATATLNLASRDLKAPGEPRATWRAIVGDDAVTYDESRLPALASRIGRLISSWQDPSSTAAVLRHGQAEHALEAHLLSGRLRVHTEGGTELQLAAPADDGVLRAAQFPTLWGAVTRPARYLDALLADPTRRPWAIELKDQQAGGGHGAYLRHGIGQAVLYRHYIRTATALDPYFEALDLHRVDCQAALAFPAAAAGTSPTIARLRNLAHRFNVEVIQFPRPGDSSNTRP